MTLRHGNGVKLFPLISRDGAFCPRDDSPCGCLARSRARPTRTIGGNRGARQPDDRMFQSIPLACSQTRLYGLRSRCDRTSHEPEGFFRLKSAKLLLQLIAVAGAPHHHALATKHERFQGSAKDELVSGPTNGLNSGHARTLLIYVKQSGG